MDVTYVHIPKTAGTSITKALGFSGGHKRLAGRLEHWDIAHHWKFTFVRHPVTRFISAFYTAMYKDNPMGIDGFVQNWKPNQRNHMMWDQVILRPQWWMVCDRDENIAIDYFGKFENITDDWRTVCQTIGKKHEYLPVENKGTYTRPELEPDTIAALHEIYARDFEVFGYNGRL